MAGRRPGSLAGSPGRRVARSHPLARVASCSPFSPTLCLGCHNSSVSQLCVPMEPPSLYCAGASTSHDLNRLRAFALPWQLRELARGALALSFSASKVVALHPVCCSLSPQSLVGPARHLGRTACLIGHQHVYHWRWPRRPRGQHPFARRASLASHGDWAARAPCRGSFASLPSTSGASP